MTKEEREARKERRKRYREAVSHLAHLLRTGWITEEEHVKTRSVHQLKALLAKVELRRMNQAERSPAEKLRDAINQVPVPNFHYETGARPPSTREQRVLEQAIAVED